MPWVLFVVSAVVIVVAGTKLARFGDQIAELSGLGLLVGAIYISARNPIFKTEPLDSDE